MLKGPLQVVRKFYPERTEMEDAVFASTDPSSWQSVFGKARRCQATLSLIAGFKWSDTVTAILYQFMRAARTPAPMQASTGTA